MSKVTGYCLEIRGLQKGYWVTVATSKYIEDRETVKNDLETLKHLVAEAFREGQAAQMTIGNTCINVSNFDAINFFIDRDILDESYFNDKE